MLQPDSINSSAKMENRTLQHLVSSSVMKYPDSMVRIASMKDLSAHARPQPALQRALTTGHLGRQRAEIPTLAAFMLPIAFHETSQAVASEENPASSLKRSVRRDKLEVRKQLAKLFSAGPLINRAGTNIDRIHPSSNCTNAQIAVNLNENFMMKACRGTCHCFKQGQIERMLVRGERPTFAAGYRLQ